MKTTPNASVRTPEEAIEYLNSIGCSRREFARRHGISHLVLKDVLSGRNSGRIGEGHKAAVLLGMKIGVILDDETK